MITRVGIRNFKAFKDQEIGLTSLNLFTGMNGMGKSTFIQSLLLLRQSSSHLIPNVFGLTLKGDLIDIGKGKDAYSTHADSDFICFELDSHYETCLKATYAYEADNDVLPFIANESFKSYEANNLPLFDFRFKYLKAERIAPEHYYRANLFAAKQGQLGYRGENVPLFIAINKLEPIKIESVKHPSVNSNTLIAHIDAWMNEITPGTHVISTYSHEFDLVKLAYQFENAGDVTPLFSPLNVGFGFTYTLPVITALLSSNKGDLVIIENPESHLHPRGQSKLGELIAKAANEGIQVIIETHSDHLLNGVRVAIKNKHIKTDDVSVYYFERNLDSKEHLTEISQPIIDSNGRISNQPKGFFDEYSKQLDALLK